MCNPPPGSSLAQGCSSLVSDGNDVSTDATVANVGIAVGVVGAGFALGWYLFAPKRPTDSPTGTKTAWPQLMPMLGPHKQGLVLGGTF